MMASEFIVDVSEADFEYEVIAYSQNTPVVVDFWAEWCIPCKTLGPLLEKIAREAGGTFRLARLDVDANQNLANRYNIRSIPAVKVFREGKVISEFVGVQPEPRLREFLSKFAPGRAELAVEKGNSLLAQEQWKNAEAVFKQTLGETPAYPPALLGLAKCMLILGQIGEAQGVLRSFPASREYSNAQTLRPLADALQKYKEGPGYSDDSLEAAYLNALRLSMRGNLEAAMDGMLDILRQDKRYRGGEVRQVLLALLEIQGEANPLNRQYRQEMASVLF